MNNEFVEFAFRRLIEKSYFDLCVLTDLCKVLNFKWYGTTSYYKLSMFHCMHYDQMTDADKKLFLSCIEEFKKQLDLDYEFKLDFKKAVETPVAEVVSVDKPAKTKLLKWL